VEKVQPDEDRDAVQQTDERLHQQLPADAPRRLVECFRGRGELSVPNQTDQAVAEIAAFEQHEDDHRRNEARSAQRSNDGPKPREGRKPRRRIGSHDNGARHGSFRRFRSQISLDTFQRFLQLFDGAAPARIPHVGDLRSDVGTIAGQVLGEFVYLPRQTPTGENERREHQRNH